ncbi:MAG: DUF5615 family PIN-like protein [Steroidobacteraceae bacterium]
MRWNSRAIFGLASATDEQIAKHALQYGAALLTRDLDFADIRRYPPDRYSRIVVLRLPDTAVAEEIAAAVKRCLSEPGLFASLSGRLAVVEGNRVRFRPPLTL